MQIQTETHIPRLEPVTIAVRFSGMLFQIENCDITVRMRCYSVSNVMLSVDLTLWHLRQQLTFFYMEDLYPILSIGLTARSALHGSPSL